MMQKCMVNDCHRGGKAWFGGTLLCASHAAEVELEADERDLAYAGRWVADAVV